MDLFVICVCHTVMPFGHVLGKGRPLGSFVCGVFLCSLSLSHTVSCVRCGA